MEMDRKKQAKESKVGKKLVAAKAVIEAMPDSVCITDLNANIIAVNRAMEELFELPREELLTMNGLDLTIEEDRVKSTKAIQDLIQSGLPQYVEVTGNLGKAKGRHFAINMALHKSKRGEPKAIVTVTRDITERKKADEEHRKKEEHFRSVIENIFQFVPEGLLVFSDKLNLLKKNKAFQNIVHEYSDRLSYTEHELAEVIIEKIKNKIINNDSTEIRISKK